MIGIEYSLMKATGGEILRQRLLALCGMAAPVWFLIALVLFGALRPDYRHSTNSISELGVFEASHALAWNVFGFGAVGVLIMLFAWGLWTTTSSRIASLLVGISGVGFAATGIFPADMEDLNTFSSRMHILASLVSLGAFVFGSVVVTWSLWRRSGWRPFATASLILGLSAVLSMPLREMAVPPGLAQRIMFATYLLWIEVLAIGVWKDEARSKYATSGRIIE